MSFLRVYFTHGAFCFSIASVAFGDYFDVFAEDFLFYSTTDLMLIGKRIVL